MMSRSCSITFVAAKGCKVARAGAAWFGGKKRGLSPITSGGPSHREIVRFDSKGLCFVILSFLGVSGAAMSGRLGVKMKLKCLCGGYFHRIQCICLPGALVYEASELWVTFWDVFDGFLSIVGDRGEARGSRAGSESIPRDQNLSSRMF